MGIAWSRITFEWWLVCVWVSQSRLTLCNSLGCSPPGSSVHGILQARRLEWVAMPSSRGSSQLRDWTWVSRIAGRFFTSWATREYVHWVGIGLHYVFIWGVCVCVYFFVRPKTKPTSFMASDHPPCCPSWWLSFLPPPLLLPMTLFLSPASPGCFLACHDFSDWHWVSDSCSPKPSPQTHPVLNSRPPAALWPPLKHAECLL